MQQMKSHAEARDQRSVADERIPQHAPQVTKAQRHAIQQRLHEVTGPVDIVAAERTDELVAARPRPALRETPHREV